MYGTSKVKKLEYYLELEFILQENNIKLSYRPTDAH
jgi:hypothetical protein